jgi:hypothetical protein
MTTTILGAEAIQYFCSNPRGMPGVDDANLQKSLAGNTGFDTRSWAEAVSSIEIRLTMSNVAYWPFATYCVAARLRSLSDTNRTLGGIRK